MPALLLTIILMMAGPRGYPQQHLVDGEPQPGGGFMASAPAEKPVAATPYANSAAEVESTLQAARQKFEIPLRPSRGKHLDAMMARFDLFDVFPSAPVPGHPGADPSKGRPVGALSGVPELPGFGEAFPRGQPEIHPPLNPFNMRSLICNYKAAELPGVDAKLTEPYGEPIVLCPETRPRW